MDVCLQRFAVNGGPRSNVTCGAQWNERPEIAMQRTGLTLERRARPVAGRPKKESRKMVSHLWKVGDFMRRLRGPAPFGSLSRAKLTLLRLEIRERVAECDWIARPADKWDK